VKHILKIKLKLMLMLLTITFIFSACSSENGKVLAVDPKIVVDPKIMKMMNEPKLLHKDDQFEMKLNINKTKFKVGEPIVYSASLTYIGDSKSITIWGPRTYVVFSVTDGKKIEMTGINTAELTATKLMQGETQEYPFLKSGAYSPNDPDAAFWKKFYAEKDLLLPAGTYLISVRCEFSLTEKVVDSHYNGEVHTTITVE
jgi:hypothetical protein